MPIIGFWNNYTYSMPYMAWNLSKNSEKSIIGDISHYRWNLCKIWSKTQKIWSKTQLSADNEFLRQLSTFCINYRIFPISVSVIAIIYFLFQLSHYRLFVNYRDFPIMRNIVVFKAIIAYFDNAKYCSFQSNYRDFPIMRNIVVFKAIIAIFDNAKYCSFQSNYRDFR